jgi:hypothetical protein
MSAESMPVSNENNSIRGDNIARLMKINNNRQEF